ncbi:MAG: type 1 glutamine amidotransferase domain-containing protein [Paracoccaceae bacterium]
MKILMVMTSHDALGETGEKTGVWLEEAVAPYYRFRDAGADVTLASPKGGAVPFDPKSEADDAQTDATRRFAADAEAKAAFAATRPLDDVNANAFDAVFYPGGHGPLWDLAIDPRSTRLIEGFLALGKPVASVCHGPAVFRDVKGPDGAPLVKGRRVTGFSDAEEEAVGLTAVVPFSLEQVFRNQGADYTAAANFTPLVVADGLLITGQNPPSSEAVADRLLDTLRAGPTATAEKAATPL